MKINAAVKITLHREELEKVLLSLRQKVKRLYEDDHISPEKARDLEEIADKLDQVLQLNNVKMFQINPKVE